MDVLARLHEEEVKRIKQEHKDYVIKERAKLLRIATLHRESLGGGEKAEHGKAKTVARRAVTVDGLRETLAKTGQFGEKPRVQNKRTEVHISPEDI